MVRKRSRVQISTWAPSLTYTNPSMKQTNGESAEDSFLSSSGTLKKILLEYFTREGKTNYCLAIDGPWGAGKSFFLKEFIEESKDSLRYPVITLSLFGLSSLAALEEKLASLISSRVLKSLDILTKAAKVAIPGLDIQVTPSAALTWFFTQNKSSTEPPLILVIDDLERLSENISMTECLGFFNDLVEKYNCRVVFVMNKEEILITHQTQFENYKEKVIRNTFKFESSPLDFLDSCKNNFPEAFPKNLDLDSYYQSLLGDNLRTFEYALENIEKAVLAHSLYGKELPDLLIHIIKFTMMVSLQSREPIKPDNYSDDFEAGVSSWLKTGSYPIFFENVKDGFWGEYSRAVDARFQIKDGSFLRFPSLTSLVLTGHLDHSKFQDDLSQYQLPHDPIARFFNWEDLEEDTFRETSKSVKNAIDNQEIQDFDTIMRVFNEMGHLAKHELLDLSINELKSKAKEYIQSLIDQDKLHNQATHLNRMGDENHFLFDAWQLGSSYFDSARKEAMNKKNKDTALFDQSVSEQEFVQFWRDYKPNIFNLFEINELAERWSLSPNKNRDSFWYAIRDRYFPEENTVVRGTFDPERRKEISSLESLVALLKSLSKTDELVKHRYHKKRLIELIERVLERNNS